MPGFSVSALMDDSSENISSAELANLEKDCCDCQLTQGRSAQNLTVNKALSFKSHLVLEGILSPFSYKADCALLF